MRSHFNRGLVHLLVAGVVQLPIVTAMSGCYERVVGVEGDPGRDMKIYEPNVKENERGPLESLEDALLGPKNPPPKNRH